MKLIGIGSKKRSGKDTFAAMLKVHLPGKSMTTAFAYGLKLEVCSACKITMEELEKDKHIFRPILQWWGTEFRRYWGKNENYWVNKTEQLYQATRELGTYRNFLLTDVRFRNEATYIKSKGGILINVVRNTGELDMHGSETSLDHYDKWDHVVDNNGTLEDLEKQAKFIGGKIYEK